MNIIVDGTPYPWDGAKLHLAEAMALAEYADLSPEEWGEHLKDFSAFVTSKDPQKLKALQCLVWMLRRRAGESPGLVADTDFDLADLQVELSEAERTELAAALEAAKTAKPEGAGNKAVKASRARPTAAA